MILFLDTSGLVKIYVEETASDDVRGWIGQAEVVGTSVVALPEAVAAVQRRWRAGEIDDAAIDTVRSSLSGDWPSYAKVEVDSIAAADLVQRHPLRGADAIHLAAALGLLPPEQRAHRLAFCSFDVKQIEAARSEGLRVLVPGDELTLPRA